MLEPTAQSQLAVIAGLLREVYGDLLEVFHYYAVLGTAQVVADRWVVRVAVGWGLVHLGWGNSAANTGLVGNA